MTETGQQELLKTLLAAGFSLRLDRAQACGLLGSCNDRCKHRRVRSLVDRGALAQYNDAGNAYFKLTDVLGYLDGLQSGKAGFRGPEESRGGKDGIGKNVAA